MCKCLSNKHALQEDAALLVCCTCRLNWSSLMSKQEVGFGRRWKSKDPLLSSLFLSLRYFIQPNILFLLWKWLTGSTLSLIIPVTFEAPPNWEVELCQGYRTMAFVHQMLSLTILPLLSVSARGNKHPTVAVLLGKGTRISPVTLLISSPHTDTAVLEVRGMFSPLFSGPH